MQPHRPETTNSNMITVTDKAFERIKKLIDNETTTNLKLRLFIQGGGCSGLTQEFAFDENINEDDTVILKENACLLIDAASMQYLDGSTVDYEETIAGSQFVIKNPNKTASCGCGKSFAV